MRSITVSAVKFSQLDAKQIHQRKLPPTLTVTTSTEEKNTIKPAYNMHLCPMLHSTGIAKRSQAHARVIAARRYGQG